MTTRDIQAQLQELSGVEVSPTLISNVTEAVMEEVQKTAEPSTGSHLSHCVPALPGGQGQRKPERKPQSGLLSAGGDSEWEQGEASNVAL